MILQSLEELEYDLQLHAFRQVYVILGPEEYQCRLAISLIKRKVLSPEELAFNYSEFAAQNVTANEIIETANTIPMLAQRRLIMVTEADKLTDRKQDEVIDRLKDLSERSVLVLLAKDLDRRKRFYKQLKEKACVVEFPKLKGFGLERWAAAFLRKQGYRLSTSAVRKLVELAGSDLQSVANEIEKLILYAGKTKNIPDSAVDEMVQGSYRHGIFELIGNLGRRDRTAALSSLANLLDLGEHSLVIVTMMARHYRQVLIAKDLMCQGRKSHEIAAAAQIPAFILDQFLRQARTADLKTVRKIYIRLAEIDRRLKSSGVDGRMLLEELICSLT